eukprot:gene15652-6936_t
MVKIAVIGAGIIGLSSAHVLKTFDDHLDITLFAEKFSPNTTSDGAAGIFKVNEVDKGLTNTSEEKIRSVHTASILSPERDRFLPFGRIQIFGSLNFFSRLGELVL